MNLKQSSVRMTKKPPPVKTSSRTQNAHDIIPSKRFKERFNISDGAMLQQKLTEIGLLLWVPDGAGKDFGYQRLARALELYESLEPADGAEGMLAVQMVGTHEAALECLKRAALPNQTFEGRDMVLKQAHKLMNLYTKQLATLNKHRGKGQQKVTVEHVNVHAGGQAIVGNVETGTSAGGAPEQAPEALEHKEMPVLDDQPAKAKARRKKP